MNRGDADTILLNINVGGEPIGEDYADELELTFNSSLSSYTVRKTTSSGTIIWDNTLNKFVTYLSQEDTFKLLEGTNTWQLRLLKGTRVISTILGVLVLGKCNSNEVLNNNES